MLHKVEALDTYAELKVADGKYGKVLEKGFQFEVDDERLDVLLGNNAYHKAFVKLVKEKAIEEKAEEIVEEVKEENTEKPKTKKNNKK